MCKRPSRSAFVTRFAASVAICLTGLMPVSFVSDASAALIDIVAVGTWQNTNNAVINPFGLNIGDKFVVRGTYDDATFFIGAGLDAQGVTAYVDPGINAGTGLDFIIPHGGPAPNPVTFDESDHINIGFASNAQIEFDGPNVGSPGNFRNFEFHFEGTFDGDSIEYDQFKGDIQSETDIRNASQGFNLAAVGGGTVGVVDSPGQNDPAHLQVVVNDITADAGGPYVFNSGNLSVNLSGTSGGGSGFTKDFDWTGPGGTLSNSPGQNIALGLAESGLTNTVDTEIVSLSVTENFTEFQSGSDNASVSYQNTAPVVLSAMGTTEPDDSITFSSTADDVDLVANALVASFESLGPVDFLFDGNVFLSGDGNVGSASLLGIFGSPGIYEVVARATDFAGATNTLAFNINFVPEPGILALLGSGLVGLAIRRKK